MKRKVFIFSCQSIIVFEWLFSLSHTKGSSLTNAVNNPKSCNDKNWCVNHILFNSLPELNVLYRPGVKLWDIFSGQFQSSTQQLPVQSKNCRWQCWHRISTSWYMSSCNWYIISSKWKQPWKPCEESKKASLARQKTEAISAGTCLPL